MYRWLAYTAGRDAIFARKSSLRSFSVACIVTAGLIGLSACGSSKPAYCKDRTTLSDSIKGLTSVSGGLSGLQSQFQKIQSDATTLVNSAKSDFPTETSAITSSVNALSTSIKSLPSNPTAAQIAALAPAAARVASSVKSFTDATDSKC